MGFVQPVSHQRGRTDDQKGGVGKLRGDGVQVATHLRGLPKTHLVAKDPALSLAVEAAQPGHSFPLVVEEPGPGPITHPHPMVRGHEVGSHIDVTSTLKESSLLPVVDHLAWRLKVPLVSSTLVLASRRSLSSLSLLHRRLDFNGNVFIIGEVGGMVDGFILGVYHSSSLSRGGSSETSLHVSCESGLSHLPPADWTRELRARVGVVGRERRDHEVNWRGVVSKWEAVFLLGQFLLKDCSFSALLN